MLTIDNWAPDIRRYWTYCLRMSVHDQIEIDDGDALLMKCYFPPDCGYICDNANNCYVQSTNTCTGSNNNWWWRCMVVQFFFLPDCVYERHCYDDHVIVPFRQAKQWKHILTLYVFCSLAYLFIIVLYKNMRHLKQYSRFHLNIKEISIPSIKSKLKQ